MDRYFLYFAYGSNLLRQRLCLQNPSAQFEAIGRLQVILQTFIYYWNINLFICIVLFFTLCIFNMYIYVFS